MGAIEIPFIIIIIITTDGGSTHSVRLRDSANTVVSDQVARVDGRWRPAHVEWEQPSLNATEAETRGQCGHAVSPSEGSLPAI